VGGSIADLALLAPRGRGRGAGPNEFPVNKTFRASGIPEREVGAEWRLVVRAADGRRVELDRDELGALEQVTAELPIACVEGWSATRHWTGVRLRDLAGLVGIAEPETVEVRSLQARGALSRTTLNSGQARDAESLLALRVNGATLSLDHGFPARIVVPALPGVHCTKWVGELRFA
jgi:DMSO/TMAO reductase YedYZ molybdopterin-dependent catalytic subunit